MKQDITFFLVLSIFSVGCSARMMKPTRESGEMSLKYLSESIPSEEVEKAEKDLSRSCSQSYWPYDIWINMMFKSAKLAEARTIRYNKDEAYKRKWSEAESSKNLAADLAADRKNFERKRCFFVEVETNDPFANDSSSWHGEVITHSGERLPITFDNFDGFNVQTTHVYADQYSAGSYTKNEYHMFSSACTSQPFDDSKGFKLIVDPRYKKQLKSCELEWRAPK